MTEESMVSVIALLERKEDFDGEIFSKIVSEIKEKYESSAEGRNIDGLIEMTRP